MNRRRKVTFVAGGAAIAALVVGLGAAGAVAASRMLSPSEESKAVIDDAAAQLGVKPQALSDALKQALKNRVDEAVDAGTLTKEEAAKLKERIDSDEYPLLFGHGGGPDGREFGHHGHFEILATASAYLGMSEADLRAALDDQTPRRHRQEEGQECLRPRQGARRSGGEEDRRGGRRRTDHKAQASELKSELAERMQALVNGELGEHGERPGPGFWPGSGSPRAPPAFGGPRA